MATLILTAVGSAIGGPIGGAIGAMIGQSVDQRLFAPGAREGPRLTQLAVQTSSYGTPIPKIFGTMRVAGTVIWATDLREDRRTVSQGKGRPKANIYSYSASFAVALSARPGRKVARIWADGKLLRGSAGDFKISTGFRFHAGDDDQPVDPLIASVEGADRAPAYRGLCYCVFEDLALESFGNRIPMLSFELIADEGPVRADTVLNTLAGNVLLADNATPLIGYATGGATMRGAITPLVEALGLDAWDDGHVLRLTAAPPPAKPIMSNELGARPGVSGGPARLRKAAARMDQISTLQLAYADPARDFQTGTQKADLFRPGRSATHDLSAALEAAQARKIAMDALIGHRARAEELSLSLPHQRLDLLAGGTVAVEGDAGAWCLTALALDSMRLEVRLRRAVQIGQTVPAADAGRAIPAADVACGETRVLVAELPWLDAGVAQKPLLVVAAAGTLPGWRKATLLQSDPANPDWTDIGETAAPAIFGQCLDPLPPAPPHLIDRRNSLTVDLLHDGMALSNCDEVALLAGRNLMLVGGELIQFARASRIGPARYQLSVFLRGRRGTEDRIADHQPGEAVLLLSRDSLLPLDVASGAAEVRILATGVADAHSVEAKAAIQGLATRPLSPVHLKAVYATNGDLSLSWVRRSRDGWAWPDILEAPLSEELERYHLIVTPDAAPAWREEVDAPRFGISAARLATLRAAGVRALDWEVRHLGQAGLSPPARQRLTLL